MKIVIALSSSWCDNLLSKSHEKGQRNQLLKRDEINKEYPEKLKISQNTIKGILYRLCGEQRKMNDIKDRYLDKYLTNMKFVTNLVENEELMALRPIDERENPSSFVGIPKDEPSLLWKESKFYQKAIFPLVCSESELYDLFVHKKLGTANVVIRNRLNVLNYYDQLENKFSTLSEIEKNNLFKNAAKFYTSQEDKELPLTDKDNLKVMRILGLNYSVFLMSQMEKELNDDISINLKNKDRWDNGISNRGITPKDFVSGLTDGKKGLVIHSPLVITKQSGTIEISLDVTESDQKDLETMINDAGVNTFNIGKKGLAYIERIE